MRKGQSFRCRYIFGIPMAPWAPHRRAVIIRCYSSQHARPTRLIRSIDRIERLPDPRPLLVWVQEMDVLAAVMLPPVDTRAWPGLLPTRHYRKQLHGATKCFGSGTSGLRAKNNRKGNRALPEVNASVR